MTTVRRKNLQNINIIIVLIEGILSIFSPCIFPILPIYLSMLANSSVEELNDPSVKKNRILINTLFFTIGISTTFFILGSATMVFQSYLGTNKNLLQLIGGIIIIIMGLFYLGIIQSNVLNREKRFQVKQRGMSPVSAFVLGFTFSFGWTPCIGPILASVLVMASGAESRGAAFGLILVYTIGFILPFLIVSLFYQKLSSRFVWVKQHMPQIKKFSGALILIAGVIMAVQGTMNLSKELKNNTVGSSNASQSEEAQSSDDSDTLASDDSETSEGSNSGNEATEEENRIAPLDFTLYDQYGEEHTLSEYQGKTVFLNIWATWCPPCRDEMPYINELYKEYGENQEDVIILGVASPNLGKEGSEEDIITFLEENEHEFPVVMDTDATMVYGYGINAFPSTIIIDKDGYIVRYVKGGMDKETMQSLIESER